MNRFSTPIGAVALAAMGAMAVAMPLPQRIVLMWQVTGKDYKGDFKELAEMGVNAAQSFSLVRQSPDYVGGYLSAAAANGVGVIPFLDGKPDDPGSACKLSSASREFVRRYAGHPAILAWHSVDEPGNHGISKACQQQIYKDIKSLDPRHPVMMSINYSKQAEYDQYFTENAFDLLDLHKYVNPTVGKGQEQLIELFKQNRKRRYPVILTLRAFDAPGKIRRLNMQSGNLRDQYAFFIDKSHLTKNVGFYGWELAPNRGIKQLPMLRDEAKQLMREKKLERSWNDEND